MNLSGSANFKRRFSSRVGVPLLFLLVWTSFAGSSAVGQAVLDSPPVIDTFQQQSKTTLVDSLKNVQRQIAAVVDKNMESCVAISDGVGFGTGVVVSPDGLVLTAGHVMSSGKNGKYEIIFPGGQTVSARPLGRNLNVDAGMIQLVGEGPWPYAEMNPDDRLRVGDWVVSLGHSGGFELGRKPPVRAGRILKTKNEQVITDAILIGGDSGGPLFNLAGQLIGIHSSIGDTIAHNSHVKLATFRRDWDRMLRGETWGKLKELNEPGDKTKSGRIGINVNRTTPRAVVKSVGQGSAGEEVGLLPGDIVSHFDDVVIHNGSHLIDVVKRYHVGDIVLIKIERKGSVLEFELQLK